MTSIKNQSLKKTLEGRLLRVLLIITILSSTSWALYRIYNNIGIQVIFMHAITALAVFALYQYYVRRQKFERVALLYFGFVLALLTLGYFPSGGMSGAVVPISVIFFVTGLLILPPRFFLFFAVVIILLIGGLGGLEVLFPDLITYKKSHEMQVIESIAAHLFMLIVLGFFLYYFKKEYVNEEERKAFLNEKLLKEKEKVELSERNKSKILSAIWQEMNAPVKNMDQVINDLATTSLSDEQLAMLDKLSKNNLFLSTILLDLMDTYRTGASKASTRRIQFNLANELNDLVFIFEGGETVPVSKYIINHSNEIPDSLMGDPNRIKQAISNLLNNSSRFTKGNEIVIYTKLLYSEAQHCTVRFDLSCNGSHLTKMEQASIFAKIYNTSEVPDNVDYNFTLIIAKNLIETLGSTLHFTYRNDQSFSFYFDLILEIADDQSK